MYAHVFMYVCVCVMYVCSTCPNKSDQSWVAASHNEAPSGEISLKFLNRINSLSSLNFPLSRNHCQNNGLIFYRVYTNRASRDVFFSLFFLYVVYLDLLYELQLDAINIWLIQISAQNLCTNTHTTPTPPPTPAHTQSHSLTHWNLHPLVCALSMRHVCHMICCSAFSILFVFMYVSLCVCVLHVIYVC